MITVTQLIKELQDMRGDAVVINEDNFALTNVSEDDDEVILEFNEDVEDES